MPTRKKEPDDDGKCVGTCFACVPDCPRRKPSAQLKAGTVRSKKTAGAAKTPAKQRPGKEQ